MIKYRPPNLLLEHVTVLYVVVQYKHRGPIGIWSNFPGKCLIFIVLVCCVIADSAAN